MSEVVKLTARANITVRTSELRFVRRRTGVSDSDVNTYGTETKVLQQLYKNLHTGEQMWKDVECVDES